MNVLQRLQQGSTPSAQPETAVGVGKFADGLVYGVRSVIPYRPSVSGNFPSVEVRGKAFMPPSMQPQMLIRRGMAPIPSGPTVPPGFIHPNGSK